METLRRSRHGPQAQYLQNLLMRRGYAISARNAVGPKVRAGCGVPVAEPGPARSAFGDRRHVMSDRWQPHSACAGLLLCAEPDGQAARLRPRAMSAFLGSPRILKGGIVLIDAASSTVLQVIALQYAPDSLTHSLAVQTVSADGVGRLGVLRLKGLPAFPGCTSAVATFGHGLQEADRT